MLMIEPIEVTDDVLLSTTAESDSTSAYDPDTKYSKGDVVAEEERRYESMIDDNDTYPPDNTLAEVGPGDATWLDLGATNKWRPFDQVIAAQCEGDGDLEIEIDPPSAITAVAFFNLDATRLEIEIPEKQDDDTWETVWLREDSLIDNTMVYDAWTYAYAPIHYQADLAAWDLPTLIEDARLTLRIKHVDDDTNAKVGQIVMGRQVDLGMTTYGSQAGIDDWSTVERDKYGNATIRRRRHSRRFRYDVTVDDGDIYRVQSRLIQYLATPAVYVGAIDRPETLVFGFYRDFAITIQNPAYSRADIEVEGLT